MGQTIKNNYLCKSRELTLLLLLVVVAFIASKNGYAQPPSPLISISNNDFSAEDQTIYISDTWKFRAGDSLIWSQPAFSDSSWQVASTYLGPSELPFIDWNGIGWFRIYLKTDSTLVNRPLALLIEQHNGASEIYWNGELIHSMGMVSSDPGRNKPFNTRQPIPIIFTDTTAQLLSVRYANHEAEVFNDLNFSSGFRFLIGDLTYHTSKAINENTNLIWLRFFFTGLLLAFTVIHLFLFAYYPEEKRNLYFALFTGFLTLLTFTIIKADLANVPYAAIRYYQTSLIVWILTAIYALRFAYSLFYEQAPKMYWGFFVVGIGLAIGSWLNTQLVALFRELFVFITVLEIFRVLAISFFKKREGIWLIGSGLIFFAFGILFTILTNLDLIQGDPVMGNLYGATGLILAMSIYLSRNFARVNKSLKANLREVKQLSERSLKQERIRKQQELERKVLEVENKRKTEELENARNLQLSMLPDQLPEHHEWEMAVFMKTAQEVGGDFYDFTYDDNRKLTLTLGDATGHGMKSGVVVATAKSYFHTYASEKDMVSMVEKMSAGIRNMDLKMMYMSMLFMKLDKHKIEYASAGMPPVLHYKKENKSIQQVLLKSMPLGGSAHFPYKKMTVQTKPGDVLLAMSDGLMELFNSRREMLGLDAISKVFSEHVHLSADEIITKLSNLANEWAGKDIQQDDISLLVLKAKDSKFLKTETRF